MQEARQNAARQQYEEERAQNVREKVGEVWTASKTDCMCFGGEALVRPSPGDRDQNCPYCICDEDGGDVATVTTKCRNEECAVCILMNKLDKPTLTALGLKRNERLTAMLDIAPSIAQSLNSGEVPEARQQQLSKAFGDLLGCSRTKLRYVANVGVLVMFCPNLKHLHLKKGWGDMWCNLSKFATAIGHHQDRRSQIAALLFMRQKCIADDNKWLWFLQSEDPEEEQTIEREVFQAGNSSTAQLPSCEREMFILRMFDFAEHLRRFLLDVREVSAKKTVTKKVVTKQEYFGRIKEETYNNLAPELNP